MPSLTNLVRLSLLKRVSPDLLVRLLRPFEGFLEPRGVDLDDPHRGGEWLARLHEVLTRVDPAMPGALQQALVTVSELTSADEQAHARESVGERQLGLFPEHGELSDEDLAVRLYLDHRNVAEISHAKVRARSALRYVFFLARAHRPLRGGLTESRRILLADDARHWFVKRNRSPFIDVRVFEEGSDVIFQVVHGQPPRTQRVIASPFNRDRITYVPDREDILVFDQLTGKLAVNAQYAVEQDYYRRLVGRIYFGDDDHFEARSVLTVEPLLADPEWALSPEGIVGLEAVMLRELALVAPMAPYEMSMVRAKDLRSLLPSELQYQMRRARRVVYIKLALQVQGLRTPIVVHIAPPRTLTFDQQAGKDVVLDYLLTREFMRLPQVPATGLVAA